VKLAYRDGTVEEDDDDGMNHHLRATGRAIAILVL
jgi:hypothetical protein